MSTTTTYQGISDEAKPSSRVLAPPGGGSSDIFGTGAATAAPAKQSNKMKSSVFSAEPDEPAQQRRSRPDDKSGQNIFGAPEATSPNKPAEAKKEEEEDEEEATKENNNQPEAATNYKPKGSTNPITGEAFGNQDSAQKHTSITIKQPPGGRSAGLW